MTTTPQAAQVLTDLIIEHLTSAYACTRVWSAWQVGTMSENDFVPLSETDFAQDLAQDILAKLQAATPAEPAQAAELPDERAAFEQWASDNGEFPRAVARSGDVYHLMATQTYWLAWQARAALSARKPLTDEQRAEVFRAAENRMVYALNLSWRNAVVEEVERAHGIGLEVKP